MVIVAGVAVPFVTIDIVGGVIVIVVKVMVLHTGNSFFFFSERCTVKVKDVHRSGCEGRRVYSIRYHNTVAFHYRVNTKRLVSVLLLCCFFPFFTLF